MNANSELWTIEELGAQAALALADYGGAPNARIRDVPALRTIRYYTTLGLLDRPAQMQGRTALYGRKHLLQLVAIKRLQTQALSLTEIQQRLLGKSEKELESVAQVSTKQGKATRRGFWKREEEPTPGPAEEPSPPPVRSQREEALSAPAASLHGVPLGENVVLLFAPLRAVTPEDVEALQAAAGPVLKYLEKRRLLAPPPRKETP